MQAGYTGGLYPGKGLEIIEKIHSKLSNIDFHIVGGTETEVKLWKKRIPGLNVHFHGFQPNRLINNYINMFDVCLLPNQKVVYGHNNTIDFDKSTDIGKYTSPIKLFEYMSNRKIIIASDIKVLREILNNKNAILVSPTDYSKWISTINIINDNKDGYKDISNRAYSDFIDNYTWDSRAKKILSYFKSKA